MPHPSAETFQEASSDAPRALRATLRQASRSLAESRMPLFLPEPGQSLGAADQGHFHARGELFIQCGGATEFRFPAQSLVLGSGQALLIPPHLPHAERALPEAGVFSNLVLLIDGAALSVHLAEAGPDGQPRIAYPEYHHHPSCLRAGRWIEEAVDCGMGEEGGAGLAGRCLVSAAVAESLGVLESEPVAGSSEPRLVSLCRNAIRNQLGDVRLAVGSLAEQLACNPSYLSHLFRASTGLRISELITEMRMERAGALLANTELSVKETCWACGFANHSYFIRCFRARYGETPGSYRGKLRQGRVMRPGPESARPWDPR